jgi:hypothetical protein
MSTTRKSLFELERERQLAVLGELVAQHELRRAEIAAEDLDLARRAKLRKSAV